MKKVASIVAALALGLTSAMAFADPGQAGEHKKPHHDMMKARDCAKAPADMKDRCEAHNKIIETCKAKPEGEERKKCMMENRPKKADK